MLRQIYCSEETTCCTAPLEKRKIIKKTFFSGTNYGSGNIFAIFFVIFFMWLFTKIVRLNFQEGFESAPLAIKFVFSPQNWVILLFAGLLFSLIYQIFYYRYYFYDIKNDGIIIRKGVIARNEINIDYGKIQNVFVDQDFWDRIFGLYDVHIATADFQSAAVAHIDGVSQANSETLKNEIIKRAQIAHQTPHQNQGL